MWMINKVYKRFFKYSFYSSIVKGFSFLHRCLVRKCKIIHDLNPVTDLSFKIFALLTLSVIHFLSDLSWNFR